LHHNPGQGAYPLAHHRANENRPQRLSPGRLAARSPAGLRSDHGLDQGRPEQRDRVRIPGTFLRLRWRHMLMVSRPSGPGNCICRPTCSTRSRSSGAAGPASPAMVMSRTRARTPSGPASVPLPRSAVRSGRKRPGDYRRRSRACIHRAAPGHLWTACAYTRG